MIVDFLYFDALGQGGNKIRSFRRENVFDLADVFSERNKCRFERNNNIRDDPEFCFIIDLVQAVNVKRDVTLFVSLMFLEKRIRLFLKKMIDIGEVFQEEEYFFFKERDSAFP